MLQLFGPYLGISYLPNLFLPQGLCVCFWVCLKNPTPRYLYGSLIFVPSDLGSGVTQRDLRSPGLEYPTFPSTLLSLFYFLGHSYSLTLLNVLVLYSWNVTPWQQGPLSCLRL